MITVTCYTFHYRHRSNIGCVQVARSVFTHVLFSFYVPSRRSHTDQRLQQLHRSRSVRRHAHEPAEQQHILHARRTVEDDAPEAQPHVHRKQAEVHERAGECG